MERHTYQTGIIGNCGYLAHVHKNTNIEWLCWPRFDSTFIFGGLLDKNKGGEFSILPEGDFTSNQYYLENTNVLITEITCKDLFVHFKDVQGGVNAIKDNDNVEYEVEEGRKGLQAVNVKKV